VKMIVPRRALNRENGLNNSPKNMKRIRISANTASALCGYLPRYHEVAPALDGLCRKGISLSIIAVEIKNPVLGIDSEILLNPLRRFVGMIYVESVFRYLLLRRRLKKFQHKEWIQKSCLYRSTLCGCLPR